MSDLLSTNFSQLNIRIDNLEENVIGAIKEEKKKDVHVIPTNHLSRENQVVTNQITLEMSYQQKIDQLQGENLELRAK